MKNSSHIPFAGLLLLLPVKLLFSSCTGVNSHSENKEPDTLVVITKINVDTTFTRKGRDGNFRFHITAAAETDTLRLSLPVEIGKWDGHKVFLGMQDTSITISFTKGVRIHITSDSLAKPVDICADSLFFVEDKKNAPFFPMAYFRHNVMLTNGKDSLLTGQLTWNGFHRQFNAEGHIRISDSKGMLDGEGLEADALFRSYVIKKPQSYTLRPQ